MKTKIFENAIKNRNRISFLYGLNEVSIEPYYMTFEKNGSKVIYGKVYKLNEIQKFDFSKIANIKILEDDRFAPVIPFVSYVQ
ncbi:MAG TPA: hypothetical protein VF870_09395 [Ignavibacteriaceae bacterium]|jgi:hypothetical protein